MTEFHQLKNILFIDIETVSTFKNFENLSDRMQACWQHKSQRIAPEVDPSQAYTDKAAIFAEFGKVITISAGFFFTENGLPSLKIKSLLSHDEHELLSQFIELVTKFSSDKLQLCAHNGKEFDYPYLCRRMIVNNLPLPKILDIAGLKPWEVKHFDTMEMWKYGDKKSYTSLELLAATLGVPSSKTGIDGSQVGRVYYEENDIAQIAQYCSQDVATTAQIFLRMHQLPLIEPNRIVCI